jgi:hypothetical protein
MVDTSGMMVSYEAIHELRASAKHEGWELEVLWTPAGEAVVKDWCPGCLAGMVVPTKRALARVASRVLARWWGRRKAKV